MLYTSLNFKTYSGEITKAQGKIRIPIEYKSQLFKLTLREKCSNMEFFLVRIFLYSARI